MKLTELKDFVSGHRSMIAAAQALEVPKQNVSYALRGVKGRTFVLEQDDGQLVMLREVPKRTGSQ